MPKPIRIILPALLLLVPLAWWGLRATGEDPPAAVTASASAAKEPAAPARAPTPSMATAGPPSDASASEEPVDEALLEEQKDGSGPCIGVEVTARGAPVPGARVNAVRNKPDSDPIELHPVIVGADGRGQGWCKPGEYLFAANAPGFAPEVATLVVQESDKDPRVRFELKAGHTLRGHVLDADSKEPVAGAQLSFTLDEGSEVVDEATAISDARGDFQVGDLAEGTYTVVVKAPGHSMALDEAEIPASKPLIISLRGTARLEGQVIDGSGAPVPGATVEASTKEPVMQELTPSQTDAQGHFSLEVAQGTYLLAAKAKGQTALHKGAVTVARGGLVDGLVIQLQPAGTLSGKVFIRSSKKAVVGADVWIRHVESDFGYQARTDRSGGFRLELLPGHYSLSVSPDGFVEASKEGLEVQAGQEVAVELSLIQSGSISGTVKDGSGHPAEGAEVSVQLLGGDGSEDDTNTETSGEDGSYSAIELVAGKYRLEARLAPGGRAAVREISLQEGERAEADFVISQVLGEVQGTVQHAGGGPPLQEVWLTLSSEAEADLPMVDVDEAGQFSVKLLPGRYSFKARYVELLEEGPEQSVTVEAGKVSRVRITAVGSLTETSGVVLSSRGEPVSEASVSFLGDKMSASEVTDAQGRFVAKSADDTAGSTVLLSASGDGEAVDVPDVRVGSRGVVVRLQPKAALRGRVVPARGPPVQGFELYTERGLRPRGLFPRDNSRPFAGESFELLDVAAGSVELVVRTSDGRCGKVRVQLEPGRTQNVEVPVGGLGKVMGRLASGEARVNGSLVVVDRDTPNERWGRAEKRSFELLALEPGAHVLEAGRKKIPFTLHEGEALELGDL